MLTEAITCSFCVRSHRKFFAVTRADPNKKELKPNGLIHDPHFSCGDTFPPEDHELFEKIYVKTIVCSDHINWLLWNWKSFTKACDRPRCAPRHRGDSEVCVQEICAGTR